MSAITAKVQFAEKLLARLWDDYAKRLPYARTYQNMLAELGGTFVNDHCAFRSLNFETASGINLGIPNIKRIFEALDFEEKGRIDFPDQKLNAHYVQHENPDFPKIFISQLNVDELSDEAQSMIRDTVMSSTQLLTDDDVFAIAGMKDDATISEALLEKTYNFFKQVPWSVPSEDVVRKINEESQYGAWTLLHGYNVNHFTGFVNRHGVEKIDDIESLIEELKSRGVPMKSKIEGARGSKLRQTSTEAVRVPVKVKDASGVEKEIEWTYSYMEFAQRNEIENEFGKREMFQGFLGPQASQLLEMTKV